MYEEIRAWLNGSRDYYTGVAILAKNGCDTLLLDVLKKGPNDFRVRRVEKELLEAYERLSANPTQSNQQPKKTDSSHEAVPINQELYDSCKKEADLLYKKVMNDRAVLFALANENDFLDPNMPDKVARREQLAIAVVTGYQKVSELYDRASYVRQYGRLPNTDESTTQEYDAIPNELVKQALDNSRKALNKLKKKEATPERVVLMQKHQVNIKKLEAKWHSLQQINR